MGLKLHVNKVIR